MGTPWFFVKKTPKTKLKSPQTGYTIHQMLRVPLKQPLKGDFFLFWPFIYVMIVTEFWLLHLKFKTAIIFLLHGRTVLFHSSEYQKVKMKYLLNTSPCLPLKQSRKYFHAISSKTVCLKKILVFIGGFFSFFISFYNDSKFNFKKKSICKKYWEFIPVPDRFALNCLYKSL